MLASLPSEIYIDVYKFIKPIHIIKSVGTIYNNITKNEGSNILNSKYNSIKQILNIYNMNVNNISNTHEQFIINLFLNYSSYNDNSYFLPITDIKLINKARNIIQEFYTNEYYIEPTNILYYSNYEIEYYLNHIMKYQLNIMDTR